MDSLSFDPMAEVYDETRTVDQTALNGALDFLAKTYPPKHFKRTLYPGIGTGRIAIPLSQRGYCITGIDISRKMLAILEDRLRGLQSCPAISCQTADVTHLPFASGSFDMAIVVHLFYFVPNWKLGFRELLRAVRPGGPLVFMHTGHGAEVPTINARYKELCAGLGCDCAFPGAASTGEVLDYARSINCTVSTMADRWQWTSRIRLEQALEHLRRRAYSFTTFPSAAVHAQAMAALESELRTRCGNLAAEMEVDNQIRYAIVTR